MFVRIRNLLRNQRSSGFFMDFDDICEVFSVFKKLHTANQGKDKTIFYKDVKNLNGVMTIAKFGDTYDIFKLNLISHMSLNNYDGLLIQYDSLDGRKLYPYRLMNIKEIIVELNK